MFTTSLDFDSGKIIPQCLAGFMKIALEKNLDEKIKAAELAEACDATDRLRHLCPLCALFVAQASGRVC